MENILGMCIHRCRSDDGSGGYRRSIGIGIMGGKFLKVLSART